MVHQCLYTPVPVDAEQPDLWSEDPLILADAVWAPCYFTGWTAANHWGLTEQIFQTTVVRTGSRVRRTHDSLLEHQYLLSHAGADKFKWGLRKVWRQEYAVQMADPARTVIDSLAYPRLGGGIRHVAEILMAYLAENEAERLVEYGDRLGNRTVFKRLGYLVSICDPGEEALLRAAHQRLPSGLTPLDPSVPRQGGYDRAWGLRINVHVEPYSTS